MFFCTKNLRKRTKSILIIFLLWFFLATIYLFYFTVYSRSEYVRSSNQILFREGTVPAGRGVIFDKNGRKLAWSRRDYDLCVGYRVISNKRRKSLVGQLEKIFPDLDHSKLKYENGAIIKKDLTSEELMSVQKILQSNPGLRVKPVLKRIVINVPEVKKYIGTAEFVNNSWVGLSGIEKKYNSSLNGMDGTYIVMQDKNGRWIKGSSRRKRKMIPGQNLFLKKSVNDIIQGAK